MGNNGNERGDGSDDPIPDASIGPGGTGVDGDVGSEEGGDYSSEQFSRLSLSMKLAMLAQGMQELVPFHRMVGRDFHLAMGDRAGVMKEFFARLAARYPFYQGADEIEVGGGSGEIKPVRMEFTGEDVERFKAILDRLNELDEDARIFVGVIVAEGAGGSGSGSGESHEDQSSGNIDTLIELVRELIGKVGELNDLHNAVGTALSLMMTDRAGEVEDFYAEVAGRMEGVQIGVNAIFEKMLATEGGDFGNGADVPWRDVSDEVGSLDRELTPADMPLLAAALRMRRDIDESWRKLGGAGGLRRGGLEDKGGVGKSMLLQAIEKIERGESLGPEFLNVDPRMPISAEFDGEHVVIGEHEFRLLGGQESVLGLPGSDEVSREARNGPGEETADEWPSVREHLLGDTLFSLSSQDPVQRVSGSDRVGATEDAGWSSGDIYNPVEKLDGLASRLRHFNHLSGMGLKKHESAQNFLREAAATYLERLVGISNVGAYNDGDNAADEKPEVGSWDFSGANITVVGNEFRVKGMKGGQYVLGSLKRLEEHLETLGVQVEVVKEPYWRPAHTLPPEVKLDFVFDLQEVVKALERG